METNTTVERRIDRPIRFLRLAGALCAMFAAVGIGHGIHQANPDGGWLVPILAGLVAATALAIFWHVVIGMVVGMVRKTMLVALFAVAAVVTVVALGASAQAIATAVAGRAALSAELSAQVDDFNQKLAKAYAEATGWSAVATSANAKAVGLRTQADTESGGSNGYGKGCGPRCASLRDSAAAFANSREALNGLLQEAADDREKGEARMSDLRDAAAHADQNGFMAAAEGVTEAIASLNAIDPRPIIVNTGAVVTSKKGIDLTKETADFQASANKALGNRQSVDAPVFIPMSLGDATRRQILGAAMHGWILASAIDLLPFFFLILGFVLSREVWLNEEVIREKPTSLNKDKANREEVDSLMQRNVVPFRGAAE